MHLCPFCNRRTINLLDDDDDDDDDDEVGWGGVGKMARWNKSAIYLKRVKIDEKLLWRAYRNSPTLFLTVPSPTPYGLLLPKIGRLQPPPKTPMHK